MNINHQSLFQFSNNMSNFYSTQRFQNYKNIVPVYLIVKPINNQIYNYQQNDLRKNYQQNTTFPSISTCNFMENQNNYVQNKIQELQQASYQFKNNLIQSISQIRQTKRKNKIQKKNQILVQGKDDGRGGNCIASNISKTLLRIVKAHLQENLFYKLQILIKNYDIKSQKQNTIILLLLLYILTKKSELQIQKFQKIYKDFLYSLQQSELSCQRKLNNEQTRKTFHSKNKIMYSRFIQINKKLFNFLNKNLIQNSDNSFHLNQLYQIIYRTYDRKHRQIQKAIFKIKSIIINHQELKQLFKYYQNSISQALQEAIQFAYRRNLQKRSNHVKNNIQLLLNQALKDTNFNDQKSQIIFSYLALKIIDDKTQQIWKQFTYNLMSKKQFQLSQNQLSAFQKFMVQEIPLIFQQIKRINQSNDEINNQDILKYNPTWTYILKLSKIYKKLQKVFILL